MKPMRLGDHFERPVDIDMCAGCHCFWFDRHESLRLSPSSTLELLQFIGEHPGSRNPLSDDSRCPHCDSVLRQTTDMQRDTRFHYRRCPLGHGRLIPFFEFLREKNFLRPLPPDRLRELRRHIRVVHCSGCGAPIDLVRAARCEHCGTPLSVLDMDQPRRMLDELRRAARPSPDPVPTGPPPQPSAPVEPGEFDRQYWNDASERGLVEAGLAALARWLRDLGPG